MSSFIQQQKEYTASSGRAIQPTPCQPYHPPCPFTTQASLDGPSDWLEDSAQDLMNEHPPSIIPGISPSQVYLHSQKVKGLYTPNDLWNARCLSPAERHELYVSFGIFGRIMQSHDPSSPEYTSAFDKIKEKSKNIAQQEAQWYAQFADKRKGTLEQRTKRFKDIVVEQMQAVDISAVSQASSASSSTQVASLGKQLGADNNTAIVIDDEQDSSPRPSREQKRRAPEPEVGEDCRPAKRVTPELDESTPDKYMCLHVDSGCGGSKDCTCKKHECCRNGFTLRQLEGAVKRKYERVCSKIEEQAFLHGNLDQNYKTWENWFSKEMRDRDSTRVKACMPPLEWKPDPRMAGVNSVAQHAPASRQAAAKKPRAKPRSALERLQKRQREEQGRQVEEAISQTMQAVVRDAEESGSQGAEQASPGVPTEVCEGRERPDRAPIQVEHQEAEEPISRLEEKSPEDDRDEDLDLELFGEPSNEDSNNGSDWEQPSGGSQPGLFDASELADIFNPAVPVSGEGFNLTGLSGGSNTGMFDASEMTDIFDPTLPILGDGFSNDFFEDLL
ncbi:hypothetical protein GGP41_010169 [Bipolaris sorokiniana]|uniref:Uncharacterized protein n=1 Tax=Cochliobolus sativus TaxID=45130 RepID=A0A8H6DQ62_COCSA|nr:hypothetical protein GGP41_010169 [Bipolaris sorokiniana]